MNQSLLTSSQSHNPQAPISAPTGFPIVTCPPVLIETLEIPVNYSHRTFYELSERCNRTREMSGSCAMHPSRTAGVVLIKMSIFSIVTPLLPSQGLLFLSSQQPKLQAPFLSELLALESTMPQLARRYKVPALYQQTGRKKVAENNLMPMLQYLNEHLWLNSVPWRAPMDSTFCIVGVNRVCRMTL